MRIVNGSVVEVHLLGYFYLEQIYVVGLNTRVTTDHGDKHIKAASRLP